MNLLGDNRVNYITFSAGAASYEAAKAYENHVAENGEPESHARAKEIL